MSPAFPQQHPAPAPSSSRPSMTLAWLLEPLWSLSERVGEVSLLVAPAGWEATAVSEVTLDPREVSPERPTLMIARSMWYRDTHAELELALERGAAAWTGPDCADIVVSVGQATTTRVIGFDWHAGSGSADNENIVTFRNDTVGDDLDRWVHTLGALAITTVTFDTVTGRLLDADIEINDVAFDFSTCDPAVKGHNEFLDYFARFFERVVVLPCNSIDDSFVFLGC